MHCAGAERAERGVMTLSSSRPNACATYVCVCVMVWISGCGCVYMCVCAYIYL